MRSWPFEIFLALRYLRPRRTFVSAITVLSVLGVTVGVMVLIIVLSVMGGFERELRDKIIGFNAHVALTNGEIIYDAPQHLEKVRQLAGVVGAAPYVVGQVMAESNGRITAPFVKGIDQIAEEQVIPLRQFLYAGEFELRGDSVLVGKEWAWRNRILLGDKILVYGPNMLQEYRQQGANKSIPLPREMVVTGIFSTGFYEYDMNYLVTSMENAQRLYGLGQGVHGIAVRVDDPWRAEEIKQRWNNLYPDAPWAATWMERNSSLFSAIAMERSVMTFILFFIMIVAAMGLCSTLITITVQKTKEIGLLKALGAQDIQVMAVFVFHGVIVGVTGALIGVGLAMVMLQYRNPFRQLLSDTFHLDPFPKDIYHFPEIPAVTNPSMIVVVALAAVVICVLAALIPAWGAARIAPAKALRYE